MAFLVDVPVNLAWRGTLARWDDRFGALADDEGEDRLGVIALVGDDVVALLAGQQADGLRHIVRLAAGQAQVDRIAERVDDDMDLAGEAAAGAAERLVFALDFLAPAACWCARTMVLSIK